VNRVYLKIVIVSFLMSLTAWTCFSQTPGWREIACYLQTVGRRGNENKLVTPIMLNIISID